MFYCYRHYMYVYMPNMLKLVASNAVKPNGINIIKFLNKDKDKDKEDRV